MRVLELGGMGPGPIAAMLLADHGADVLRIDRVDDARRPDRPRVQADLIRRGKRTIGLDLKNREAVELVLGRLRDFDVFIESFRPGAAERMGLGPDACLAIAPTLVYARATGFGQGGPLAATPGHDINYIALAGSLEPIGRAGQTPTPPLMMLGDFGGGGFLLAFGILAAAYEARASGAGQVIDGAVIDGAALQAIAVHGMRAAGRWHDERGTNRLDTGSPFYEVYRTADGRFVSVGALEDKFRAELINRLGLAGTDLPDLDDQSQWPKIKEIFAEAFGRRTREEWSEIFAGSDTCFAPVLTPAEAVTHPHNVARQTFINLDGVPQPAPAPRLGRTPGQVARGPVMPGTDTDSVLAEWGLSPDKIGDLRSRGVIA
jgi:alpha-methylacyl-CoA racemase